MLPKCEHCRGCDSEDRADVALAHAMTLGLTLWLPPLVRYIRRRLGLAVLLTAVLAASWLGGFPVLAWWLE